MKEIRELVRNAELTKTQKVIAGFILDHSSDACFMTSTEIAARLGVSESSVIRFSRSLGFQGFMDFQKSLRKDYQDAADAIISSKRKYILATRGNTCLGNYFLLYLKHMVRDVETASSSSLSPFDHMCNICKDDCLIIFSFPRYSSVDRLTAQMAKESARIIVITDKPSALLADYATTLITVPVDTNTFFNSMIGPQFIAEALLETISHKVRGIDKRLKKIDRYLDELGNY